MTFDYARPLHDGPYERRMLRAVRRPRMQRLLRKIDRRAGEHRNAGRYPGFDREPVR